MKLRLLLAPLLVASTAYAQAPGDYDGQAPGDAELAPPGMAPPLAAPAPPPRVRRLSVGLGIGQTGLAPHHSPDATTDYAIGQLAIRYLFGRRFEVELAFSGGREQHEDGTEGERELRQAVLGLRWRFSPQRRWNWWVMAGMGTLSVAHHEASEDEREYASQSTLQFGIGLERRWSRFAIQAELRAVGVAPNETADGEPVMVDVKPGDGMSVYPESTSPSEGKKGAQFALSGNYYF